MRMGWSQILPCSIRGGCQCWNLTGGGGGGGGALGLVCVRGGWGGSKVYCKWAVIQLGQSLYPSLSAALSFMLLLPVCFFVHVPSCFFFSCLSTDLCFYSCRLWSHSLQSWESSETRSYLTPETKWEVLKLLVWSAEESTADRHVQEVFCRFTDKCLAHVIILLL